MVPTGVLSSSEISLEPMKTGCLFCTSLMVINRRSEELCAPSLTYRVMLNWLARSRKSMCWVRIRENLMRPVR